MSDLVGNPEDRFSRVAAHLQMSCIKRKPTMCFLIRSDTNWSVSSQTKLEAWNFGLRKKRNCTICVAKTKALISFAVTPKLICVFVFTYADCWFSHEAAQINKRSLNKTLEGPLC